MHRPKAVSCAAFLWESGLNSGSLNGHTPYFAMGNHSEMDLDNGYIMLYNGFVWKWWMYRLKSQLSWGKSSSQAWKLGGTLFFRHQLSSNQSGQGRSGNNEGSKAGLNRGFRVDISVVGWGLYTNKHNWEAPHRVWRKIRHLSEWFTYQRNGWVIGLKKWTICWNQADSQVKVGLSQLAMQGLFIWGWSSSIYDCNPIIIKKHHKLQSYDIIWYNHWNYG